MSTTACCAGPCAARTPKSWWMACLPLDSWPMPAAGFSQPDPVRLLLDGPLVSKPYVDMTLSMMGHWGATWRQAEDGYIFDSGSCANFGPVSEYDIEPDASAASYFFAAAAITGGR